MINKWEIRGIWRRLYDEVELINESFNDALTKGDTKRAEELIDLKSVKIGQLEIINEILEIDVYSKTGNGQTQHPDRLPIIDGFGIENSYQRKMPVGA